MTRVVDSKVTGVDDKVKSVEGKVLDVRGDVDDVGNKVQGVRDYVQDVRGDVQDVGNKVQDVDYRVQGVDDKLDQVNRSLFLYFLLPIPSIHASSQETIAENIFYGGFHPRIHPPIITLHATLITTVQLNGFFKEVYSINGNPMAPSCGYMESVRTLGPYQASAIDHLSIP